MTISKSKRLAAATSPIFQDSKVFRLDKTCVSHAPIQAIPNRTPIEALAAAARHLVETKMSLDQIIAKERDAWDNWTAAMMDCHRAEEEAAIFLARSSSRRGIHQ